MGADHPRHAAPEPRRLRRLALLLVAPIAVLTLAALVWLWPHGEVHDDGPSSLAELDGRVTSIERAECAQELPDEVNGCGTATIRLEQSGESVEAALPNGSGVPRVAEGDSVVVVHSESPDDSYAIVDHQRAQGLWMLALAFVVALIAFGRWRGVTALVGLGVTFAILLYFIVPAVLGGESPILVAVVGATAIMLSVLYLTHGFSLSTTVALLGTLLSLVLTGLLSALAVAVLHLTGVTDDISMAVEVAHQVDMEGLLLAGIIIGSLGVLDDVTVTQAVTVAELARANPHYRTAQLYRAASRVGRSHVASVVNTIVLAYAGASLPLLILTVADNSSLGAVVTTQLVSQEIVRSAVATLGLIAAVPLTTGLAAVTLRRSAGGERRRSRASG